MNRFAPALFATLALVLLVSPASQAAAGGSLSLVVYSDGYVHVTQVRAVDSKATSIQISLLSGVVSNLVATDGNGTPLSYSFDSGGKNITVYTLGATLVTVRYDTESLTAKNGTVWTLAFTASYNSTVVLPQFSTLIAISGTPYSINETGTSPDVTLAQGSWKVSYGVPLGTSTGSSTVTPSTSGRTNSGGIAGGLSPFQALVLALDAAALVVAGILSFRHRRRIGPLKGDLRPDDVQVLNFIREKGGRALELEIRTRFALPKTSAWRQIKRLERLGHVRVTKVGSQNQIEILSEKEPGN